MGIRELDFTNHRNKRILIKREMRGKSEKIHIDVDGVDQKLRKLPVAKAFIKKAFPITQDEYNTYVHIDSRIPHPLVMGSSSDRKKFFTSFFPIEKFDAERKLYSSELSTLGKTKAAYQELRVQLLKSKRDLLKPEVLQPLVAKRAELKAELLRLQQEFTSIQETVRLVEFASTAKEQIAILNRACASDITDESFAAAEADNKWELKKVKAELEDAEAWEQYKRDNSHYTEAFNALSAEAKALIESQGIKNAREQASAGSSAYAKAKAQVERVEADIAAIEKELKRTVPDQVTAPEENEGDLQTLRRAYAHQLEHAEQFAEGKCETCGQIVKIKDPKILRKRLDSVMEKLDRHQEARAYTEAVAERKKNRLQLKAHTAALELVTKKLTSARALAKIDREFRNLPRKPKPFTGKKLQTVVLKRAMEELTERRSLLQYLKPHLDTIIAFLKLTQAEIKAVKGSDGLSSRMNEVQEELSEAQAKIALHRTMTERVKEMRTRLLEMKTQLADEDALRLLVKGCEVQKKMAIESISQRLMVLVNKYSSVFPENFKFEFDWGTQVSLIVHRKDGNKTLSSDVRKLSGAESTLFTLILVCALLNFVPAHKRCSVLILDEPTARLSKELTEVFYSIVKILNTLIPSIVIITPKDDYFEGARNFTVVKERGVSRLVDGMPHQIKL